jgi:hypothetical protein
MEKKNEKGKWGYKKIMGYGIGILRLINICRCSLLNNCIQFHSPKDFRARNHQVGDSPDYLFKQVQLIPFWSCFIQNQIACPLQNSYLHRIAFSLRIFFKIAARNYILFNFFTYISSLWYTTWSIPTPLFLWSWHSWGKAGGGVRIPNIERFKEKNILNIV